MTGHEVVDVGINGTKLVLSVRRGGDMKKMETDHVIAATGYRVHLRQLPFLDPALYAEIE